MDEDHVQIAIERVGDNASHGNGSTGYAQHEGILVFVAGETIGQEMRCLNAIAETHGFDLLDQNAFDLRIFRTRFDHGFDRARSGICTNIREGPRVSDMTHWNTEASHNAERLLAKARRPVEESTRQHPLYRGKIQVVPKCPVRGLDDFAIWYTPGVAVPCRAIQAEPESVYELTNKANSVAIVADGARVLGLGNIGPEAGLPIMEGKALLFKYLGGVDKVPVCLATVDPEEIVRTVQILQPAFGAINIEDIAQPKCFRVLDRLRATMSIPSGTTTSRARRPYSWPGL